MTSKRIHSENLSKLTEYIKEGIIKPNDIIKIVEKDVKEGKSEPEMLTFTIKYLNLLDKINNSEDKLININELVDMGIYDSVDDIRKIINENYEEFKDDIFTKKPYKYPEPTEEEINQSVDSDNPEKVCLTCYHRRRHTIFVPCGHACLCSVCTKNYIENYLKNSNNYMLKCPICRKDIDKIQKIFL
jgi:hypothetical protein